MSLEWRDSLDTNDQGYMIYAGTPLSAIGKST
jgi:hypothetical protein